MIYFINLILTAHKHHLTNPHYLYLSGFFAIAFHQCLIYYNNLLLLNVITNASSVLLVHLLKYLNDAFLTTTANIINVSLII